jgi:hypothetical protein
VPHPAPLLLLRAVAVLLVAATAYRLASPALAAAGLPEGDLGAAAAAAPFATALALLFGGAAAAAVCAFPGAAPGRSAGRCGRP